MEIITHGPTYKVTLGTLRNEGTEYPGDDQKVSGLGDGLTHKRNGVDVETMVDDTVTSVTNHVYASDSRVRAALAEHHDVRAHGTPKAAAMLGSFAAGRELVWGFSGYATGGRQYRQEAEAITALFEHMRSRNQLPAAVITGGTRYGVPRIASLVAQRHGVKTIGIVPRQGLDDIALQEHLIVHGKQFGDEARLVGAGPDVLVALGGGPNTAEEYRAALRNGATVIRYAIPNYRSNALQNTYRGFPETQSAAPGKLIVCNTVFELIEAAERVFASAQEIAASRDQRKGAVARELGRL